MNKNGLFLGLFSIVAFSLVTPFSRGALLSGMEVETLIFFRVALGSLLFTAFAIPSGMLRTKEDEKPLGRRGVMHTIIAGLINAFAFVTFYKGVSLVEASLASMSAAAIYSIVVMVLTTLRGNTMTPQTVVRLGVGLIGLFFLLGPGGDIDPIGLAWVAVSAVAYGIFLVYLQFFLSEYNPNAVTLGSLWTIAVAVGLLWLFKGADTVVTGRVGWTAIFAQAILASFLGRAAMYAAIKRMGSGEYTLLTPMETLLTTVWAVIFLAEYLSVPQVIGAGLVVGSLILAGKKTGLWLNEKLALRRLRPAPAKI